MAAQELAIYHPQLAENATALMRELETLDAQDGLSEALDPQIPLNTQHLRLLYSIVVANTLDHERWEPEAEQRYLEDMQQATDWAAGPIELDANDRRLTWAGLMGMQRPSYEVQAGEFNGQYVSLQLGAPTSELVCDSVELYMQSVHGGGDSRDFRERRALDVVFVEQGEPPAEAVAAQLMALNGIITATRQAVGVS
jgi:hypothetical protein